MRTAAIVLCLALAGCAHDAYTANDPSLQPRMRSDLHDCKWDVSRKIFAPKDSDGGAVFAGGLLFGAIGGAIMGAATAAAHSDDNANVSARFSALVEQCMAEKGYSGVSDD